MAPDAATITADSSPTEILKSLTPAQTKEWRTTGKLPDIPEAPPKEKTEAASSTAATTAVTEPPKAESSVAPATTEPKSEKPKGAEARIKELLAANKKLEADLEAARKAPVVAPAKIEEIAKPRRNDVDVKTGQPMYASDEAYDEAFEKYLTSKVTADVEKRTAKAQSDAKAAEQNRIIEARWQNALKIAHERHPDFKEVCQIDGKGKFNNPELVKIKDGGILSARILKSDIGAVILYYLASNPGEVEKFQDITDAFDASDAFLELEQKCKGTATTTPTKEAPATRSSETVTRAPAPPSSVGGRATAPADETEAALKREDFRSYRKNANAEDFKKRKAS